MTLTESTNKEDAKEAVSILITIMVIYIYIIPFILEALENSDLPEHVKETLRWSILYGLIAHLLGYDEDNDY